MTSPHDLDVKLQVRLLLASSVGLSVFPRRRWLEWQDDGNANVNADPLRSAFFVSSSYFLAFVVIPVVLRLVENPPLSSFYENFTSDQIFQLYLLQTYGALWAGWATLTTKLLSSSLGVSIYHDIIPYLSASTSMQVAQEIRRRFPRRRFLLQSWGLGVAFAALSSVLVYQNTSHRPDWPEIAYWCLGWSLLFATAAGVVKVATFYEAFARNLSSERDLLFSADPARASLVTSIAYLGQSVLLFWLSIAFSIAFIIPFSLTRSGASPSCPVHLHGFSICETWFVGSYIVLASVFSIGLGVLGFLRSEANLRRVVREVTWRTLRGIEKRAAVLTKRIGEPTGSALDDLLKLNEAHQKISTGGSYRGLILSSASILLPFVAPVIAIISLIIGKRS